ncbi:RNA polymerase factor sigma-54 [bacterium]|nr:RNA polymerase factor sigma-54 [bacterium]
MSADKNLSLNLQLKNRLRQELRLTPALIQTMKLMELSTLELKEKLEEEWSTNPFLKSEEQYQNKEETVERKDKDAPDVDIDYYVDNMFGDEMSRPERNEDNVIENTLTYPETLEEHLVKQIQILFEGSDERWLATYMAGNLDEDGFLQLSSFDIELTIKKEFTHIDLKRIEAIRRRFMLLDPIGVGAYSIQEVLQVQIQQQMGQSSLACRIIEKYWSDFLKLRYEEIAKEEDISFEEIKEAVEFIKTLELYPGRQYKESGNTSIVPDAIVFLNEKQEVIIVLNDMGISKYKLNTGYYEEVNNEKLFTDKEIRRMKSKYENAMFLIKGIYQRRRSIYLITKSIFQVQKAFLIQGILGLKPLTLKEIAEKVEMHESTISRITRNKYIQTSDGIFQLKYFFSSKLDTYDDSESVSSKVVKEYIKELIDAEPTEKPLSDQVISDLITKKYNIAVARRTVAKYRGVLNIPTASIRKRMS